MTGRARRVSAGRWTRAARQPQWAAHIARIERAGGMHIQVWSCSVAGTPMTDSAIRAALDRRAPAASITRVRTLRLSLATWMP